MLHTLFPTFLAIVWITFPSCIYGHFRIRTLSDVGALDRRLHTSPRTPATRTDTVSGSARAKPARSRFHGCKLPSAARLSSFHCTFCFFRTVNDDHSIAGRHRASQSMCEPYTGTYSTVAHSWPSVCVYTGVCVLVSTLCACRLASTACIYFCI
jgi:hypothetical protein